MNSVDLVSVAIFFGIPLMCLVFCGITAVFSFKAYAASEAARLSTHKVEYVPLERPSDGVQKKAAEEEGPLPPAVDMPERPKNYPDY